MIDKEIKISDLKPGQKVSIDGMLAEYKGIQRVRISSSGKADKKVFQGDDINIFKNYGLNEGSRTLASAKIKLR